MAEIKEDDRQPQQEAPPVPSQDNHYQLGNRDPKMPAVETIGQWKSKNVTDHVLMAYVMLIVGKTDVIRNLGYNAALGLEHYLSGSGSDYWIDFESMVATAPSAKRAFLREVAWAIQFAESLPVGSHDICSKATEEQAIAMNESRNWFFAVAGYSSWGMGRVVVRSGPKGRERERNYELDFEYKMYDGYDWHEHKSADIGFVLNIKDKWMGEFHLQGLAREFISRGIIKRKFKWVKGGQIPGNQLASIPTRG